MDIFIIILIYIFRLYSIYIYSMVFIYFDKKVEMNIIVVVGGVSLVSLVSLVECNLITDKFTQVILDMESTTTGYEYLGRNRNRAASLHF